MASREKSVLNGRADLFRQEKNYSDNNSFYNMNLSIHKVFNARHSLPYTINEEVKPISKKRRCTIAYTGDHKRNIINQKKINYDYINYNFNNSITKRRKCSPTYCISPYVKYSPLKSRSKLQRSIDESIKKSAALRCIVNKSIKNRNNVNYEHNEKNYLERSQAYYLNKHPDGACSSTDNINDMNSMKLYMDRNLSETYILSNTTQSDNYFRNKNKNGDSLNTLRETIPIYINSASTISSFNIEREGEHKYAKLVVDLPTGREAGMEVGKEVGIEAEVEAKMHFTRVPMAHLQQNNRYAYMSNLHDSDNRTRMSKGEQLTKVVLHNPLKRRHSTQIANEYDKYNYSDSHYFNKRYKGEDNKNYKNSTRRHSDTITTNPVTNLFFSQIRGDINRNTFHSSLLQEYNKNNLQNGKGRQMNRDMDQHDANNPPFHPSFFKNAEEFENDNIKRKEKIEPLSSNEEDDSVLKNDAEYLFSKGFFNDIYSNIRRKGELNFIDELLEADEEYYISKSKLNKIIENAKNKEMKYHYIDRMFLYRHAKNVIDDEDYEKYKNKCRLEHKYLDVPFPNLTEIMNLQPISNSDEIDDNDEFYDAEVKLLEKYYYKSNKERKEQSKNTMNSNKDIENKIVLVQNKNKPFEDKEVTEDLDVIEKREKLMCLMNKMKMEKDSFYEKILDTPDFSKLLEPVFSVNECFLLSHQLFNVQYAAQLGPVVYLIKTEDENYVYRAIEVSRLFEEKVKSILDNQKINLGSKDRNDCFECFSNEKFPFLHELDVKYYLRIPMSTGWNHFGYLKNQNNVLFFRRPKNG
ncbi:cyclin-dependent kinases regulatory subunit [Plasmodium brasilianum]|uniref:Cyclin-dependent kinases regulatory subunit n=2 Tax=Plasmodium (Plasmodium) TaxID=418103 RepID=A0A1A8VMU6_PLAMA|nr:conserved Plasmodium protein, unknown function [Plasmodium malariae]KAI4840936.1 cyclin-dependent kinases regulatory subunit [Plasmodium brasilianum]SBS81662.1 conserved Plasmodium protein, unknown function [Plasmodium malariae]SBT87134.1 conserved Plasmodium protein, unknown function [Plasmodium malariae]